MDAQLTQSRIKRLQREHAEFIAQKRAEAADAVLLMERGVAQRADAERAKNGLVILDAHYGRSTAFTARGLRDEFDDEGNPAVIDVTVPVQALVSASKLYIPQGPAKHNLLGFYVSPPAPRLVLGARSMFTRPAPLRIPLTPGPVYRGEQEAARTLPLPRARARDRGRRRLSRPRSRQGARRRQLIKGHHYSITVHTLMHSCTASTLHV